MKKHIPSGLKMTAEQSKFNMRSKYYPQPDGSLKLVEEMCCNRFIFNPDNVEIFHDFRREEREDYYRCMVELQHNAKPRPKYKSSVKENIARSQRRAKNALFDLIACNQWDYFITLTLSPNEIDRNDYQAIIKKLNTYLDNRVRRNGLKYIGVPELHKNGGFHFHFLVNDVLPLGDSGTVKRPDCSRPVKLSTALRLGYNRADLKTVYNISDWGLGFTTAIHTYGEPSALANYVGKYITKSDKKIGGRWYYSGGKLLKPVYTYSRESFGDFVGDYGFNCDGGAFLIRRNFD